MQKIYLLRIMKHTHKYLIFAISIFLVSLLTLGCQEKEEKKIVLIHSFEQKKDTYPIFNETLKRTFDKISLIRFNTISDLLLNLINDILDLSRIESGRMSFSFQQYSLNELISTIYQTFQVLMPENVELRMQIPEKSISIPTDKFRLTQVITNFLSNAIKFTQKGYILIGYEYREEERHVHIFVEDTGIGIPKEKQDAVFNRFTKLDEFAKGTGLGLSICKVIAERFDGYIAVESEIGKGSRFSIILPLNPKHTESD